MRHGTIAREVVRWHGEKYVAYRELAALIGETLDALRRAARPPA
jgi:hypothetical protein